MNGWCSGCHLVLRYQCHGPGGDFRTPDRTSVRQARERPRWPSGRVNQPGSPRAGHKKWLPNELRLLSVDQHRVLPGAAEKATCGVMQRHAEMLVFHGADGCSLDQTGRWLQRGSKMDRSNALDTYSLRRWPRSHGRIQYSLYHFPLCYMPYGAVRRRDGVDGRIFIRTLGCQTAEAASRAAVKM